ncbi:MAG: recombination protein RecR [Verrucomicrobia bacterium]|nr:recombination protein RecR [Verrucomicrobiota bacterium]
MQYPKSIQRLIAEFAKLPGVGRKSAERFALHLLKAGRREATSLGRAATDLHDGIRTCSVCGTIDETDPCRICTDEKRDAALLCVVEDVRDVLAIESVGRYTGRYHVLGGAISPLDGVGPEDLRMNELVHRVKDGGVREVILATGSSVAGDATCLYIEKLIEGTGVELTRIAFGLPVGTGIEHADPSTLLRALDGRRRLR